jgi:hypothetical protein
VTQAERERTNLLSQINGVQRQIDALTRPRPEGECEEIASAQARADSVAGMFGDRVAPPIAGETSLAYRRRLLKKFQPFSPRFKETRLDGLDASALGAIEDHVFHDAVTAARNPNTAGITGRLVAHKSIDSAGRTVTEFSGDPMAWMAPFMTSGRVGHFNRANASREG